MPNFETTKTRDNYQSLFSGFAWFKSTVKFVYNDAVCNNIPDKTIPSNVFGWFYMLCVPSTFIRI